MNTSFDDWLNQFEKTPQCQAALLFLYDSDIHERYDGNDRELCNITENPLHEERLKKAILLSCYNAARFEDIEDGKRKQGVESLSEIGDRFSGTLKAIREIRGFISRHPTTASLAIGRHLLFHCEQTGRILQPHTRLDQLLEAAERGLKDYRPLPLIHWYKSGCIIFPRTIKKKRLKANIDSLLFELAFIIRNYINDGSTNLYVGELPLPKGKKLQKQNQIISQFAQAVFKEKISPSKVKTRLDALQKEKTM